MNTYNHTRTRKAPARYETPLALEAFESLVGLASLGSKLSMRHTLPPGKSTPTPSSSGGAGPEREAAEIWGK